MKAIKRKEGVVYDLENGETCPPGEICFIAGELDYAKRIAGGFSQDPEQTKAFWESLFERKKEIPGYVIFMDFPKADTPRVTLSPSTTPDAAARKALARKYCGDILSKLRGTQNKESEA